MRQIDEPGVGSEQSSGSDEVPDDESSESGSAHDADAIWRHQMFRRESNIFLPPASRGGVQICLAPCIGENATAVEWCGVYLSTRTEIRIALCITQEHCKYCLRLLTLCQRVQYQLIVANGAQAHEDIN